MPSPSTSTDSPTPGAIVNALPFAAYVLTDAGKVAAWNIEMTRLTGIPESRVLGTSDHGHLVPYASVASITFADLVRMGDHDAVDRLPFRVVSHNGRLSAEVPVPRDGRGERVLFVRARALYDGNGRRTGILELIEERTDERAAESERDARFDQQRAVADLGRLALAGTSVERMFEAALTSVCERLGADVAGVLELMPDGRSMRLVASHGFGEQALPAEGGLHSIDAELPSLAAYAMARSEPVIIENLVSDERFRASGLLLASGAKSGIATAIPGRMQPFGTLGAYAKKRRLYKDTDASFLRSVANILATAMERKLGEAALAHSEERYRALAEASPMGIWHVDPEGFTIYVNPAMRGMLEIEHDAELSGQTIFDFAESDGNDNAPLAPGVAGAATTTAEMRLHGRRGAVRDVLVVATPLGAGDGQAHSRIMTVLDVTATRLATEALQQSEERYRSLFEQAAECILLVDAKGRIAEANHHACELLGYSRGEFRRMHVSDLIEAGEAPELKDRIDELLAGHSIAGELRVWKHSGEPVLMEGSARALASGEFQIIGRDVTAKKRAEEELIRTQKLESLGQLAGGIAHDFNNLLTGVLGNVSLARALAPRGEKVAERLIEAEKAAMRAQDLTHQLLTFAKGGAPIKRATRIEAVLRETIDFALSGSAIGCVYEIKEDLKSVVIDAGQIGQVLHNIALNAVQAMDAGGMLRVHAANLPPAKAMFPLRDAPYVKISIKDEGPGIPDEVLPRIFDPYFSTKTHGTGLGLSICYSIITRHGGYISVDSERDVGTTFHIYLLAGEEGMPEDEPLPPHTAAPGEGRILLMDDERLVADIGRALLAHAGYKVNIAREGGEMLKMYRDATGAGVPYDVVIVDLTIAGGMGGVEAIEKLRAFHPQARAIVSSGYSTDPVLANYRDYGFDDIVRKPFRLEDIVAAVTRVMSRQTRGAPTETT